MPRMKPPTRHADPFRGTMSLDAVARLWRAPRRFVRRCIANGELPFVQIAGRIRVPAEAATRLRRR